MSLNRLSVSRDQSEQAIVAALRAAGWKVWYMSGPGVPDLLCLRKGRLVAIECKSKGGRMTDLQEDFFEDAAHEKVTEVFIVYSVKELIELGLL